jgi:glycosyltransferase involved in cell wall biosynthesis
MKNMRIAYLMHGIFYGGATRSLHLLIKSLKLYEIEKYIYTINIRSEEITNQIKNDVNKLELVKINTVSNNQISTESFNSAMKKTEQDINRFIMKLKENKIDILHINSSVFPHVLRQVKNKIPNIKIVTHVREIIPIQKDIRLYNYQIKEIEEFSEIIICISDNEEKAFRNTKKTIIIPNPFDFNKSDNITSKLRQENKLGDDTIIIGMLSHFSEAKGHLDFLKAVKIIINNSINQDIKFVIIGIKASPLWKKIAKLLIKNSYEKRVYDFISQNNINKDIILIPYTNQPLSYIKDLDILVRPALTGDPWGRDIIEAMAMKKPVIATGTSQFYVREGQTGYLVPPQNPEKIAEKIIDLINNEEKRKTFGENGYKLVKEKCDIEDYGKKIFSLYNKLMLDAK